MQCTTAGPVTLPFGERGGLIVLVDPGRSTPDDARALAERAAASGACGFLVGDSLGVRETVSAHVAAIRRGAPEVPIVQFPASADDLTPDVDAILFLVLVSGRNPRYLIDEQVRAAAFFDRHPEVRAVSTAYLLIDGGRESTVERVSGTAPLAMGNPSVIAAHVKAGQLMGMHATYLEAGSGAAQPVSAPAIRAARQATHGPLIVGGGIVTAARARDARHAGADYVVVGSLFERDPTADVRPLAAAARS
jgi:putative glycerol-1-phosphate prenyltransferase